MIFDTRLASMSQRGACEPILAVYILHDPTLGITIGMADHNPIRARDPPLPHRLDPFYPQAKTDERVSLRYRGRIAVKSSTAVEKRILLKQI
jgi:hypothetical protein